MVEEMAKEKKASWFERLKSGLKKSSGAISGGITEIFTHRKLDGDALEELEELLITSDLGVAVATKLVEGLAKTRFDKEVDPGEIKEALAAEISSILRPIVRPLEISAQASPHIILMVGVNGSGKTTTIGKLAQQFKTEGKSVMLAAGDTFRAAAIEQLQVWGQRTGVPVIAGVAGSDPAGLAFDAIDQARATATDILIVDTAGRLQNRRELMDELAKVIRVIGKKSPGAPHDTILILDATTGQNALSQVEVFKEAADISGIMMTKLDGSARGGILVACAERFGVPVHAIGVGEAVDDLHPFDADMFARTLVGLEDFREAAQ